MADQRPFSQRIGVTPTKLTLIGVLAVVLVGVLYVQYGRSDSEAAPVVRKTSAARGPRTARTTRKTVPKPSPAERPDKLIYPTDDGPWSAPGVVPNLETVVQYDPFALPATFPQPESAVVGAKPSEDDTAAVNDEELNKERLAGRLEQIQVDLEQLRQQGVQVILTEGDEFVAMIGDQTIRVGDVIGGFKVVAIDLSGVRVERAVQQ